MITIKRGNYYTTSEIAKKNKTYDMKISRIIKKLKLGVRYSTKGILINEKEVKKIEEYLNQPKIKKNS